MLSKEVSSTIFQKSLIWLDLEIKITRVQKMLRGRYAQRIRDADIDFVKTNRWLKSAGLKVEIKVLIIVVEIKGLIIVAQV